jgi:hypothetical protein
MRSCRAVRAADILLADGPLVFDEGPGRLMSRLGGEELARAAPRVILDAHGKELARLELLPRRGAKRALDLLSGLMGSWVGSGRAYDFVLAVGTSRPLLRLHMSTRHLTVADGFGTPVGEVRNASRVGGKRLEVEFRAPGDGRFLSKGGPLLASIDADPILFWSPEKPFRWEIADAAGQLVATIDHAGVARRNELALLREPEPRLGDLIVGFTAALFDRFWLQIPKSSGPN